MEGKGIYALIMALDHDATLTVGRLGEFSFSSGYYLYVGSAQRGLRARINRHLRREKALRWHIDYLRKQADIVEIWWSASQDSRECLWYKAASRLPQAKVFVTRFGSSDCRCPAHLLYLPNRPSARVFQSELAGQEVQVCKYAPFT